MAEVLEVKKNLCNAEKIEEGEILAVTYYTRVKEKKSDSVVLEDLDRGLEFGISGKDLLESMNSASQYNHEEKVSMTQIVEILLSAKNSVFTVSYNKKVSEQDVNEALSKINKGKILSNAEIKKCVKEAYKGEERVLSGLLVSSENELGRSKAIDLNIKKDTEKEYDNRIRQIDHRTINWLILNNVKYISKK